MSDPLPYRMNDTGLILLVKLSPGASRNALGPVHRDAAGHAYRKLFVTAKPVDGEANDALIRFLAKYFNLPLSAISLVQGSTRREKRLHLKADSARIDAIVRLLEER